MSMVPLPLGWLTQPTTRAAWLSKGVLLMTEPGNRVMPVEFPMASGPFKGRISTKHKGVKAKDSIRPKNIEFMPNLCK
jgi:hypothetical protein